MPRFVRPSYFTVRSDSRSKPFGTGPSTRTGELSATLSVRDAGSVLPLLDVDAIASADGASVLVRVTDKRTGREVFSERFAQ